MKIYIYTHQVKINIWTRSNSLGQTLITPSRILVFLQHFIHNNSGNGRIRGWRRLWLQKFDCTLRGNTSIRSLLLTTPLHCCSRTAATATTTTAVGAAAAALTNKAQKISVVSKRTFVTWNSGGKSQQNDMTGEINRSAVILFYVQCQELSAKGTMNWIYFWTNKICTFLSFLFLRFFF